MQWKPKKKVMKRAEAAICQMPFGWQNERKVWDGCAAGARRKMSKRFWTGKIMNETENKYKKCQKGLKVQYQNNKKKLLFQFFCIF